MKMLPSEMFKILGVETRIKIIGLLKSKGPLCVKNIAETLTLSPAAVSQHLKILRHAGFVSKERKGYWVPYSIEEEALENCGCLLMEVCTCECDEQYPLKKQKIEKASLTSLLSYKKELEEELQHTQNRISQMKSDK